MGGQKDDMTAGRVASVVTVGGCPADSEQFSSLRVSQLSTEGDLHKPLKRVASTIKQHRFNWSSCMSRLGCAPAGQLGFVTSFLGGLESDVL